MAGIEVKSIPFRRDLIHLVGPLTREAIVRQLHENFTEGHCYTWIGPVLLCVNPFENPSPQMMKTLQNVANNAVKELYHSRRARSLIFSGMSGSGKTFTCDRLIIKMFSESTKSEWLQDIRKYWQVSSVVLKALGTAGTFSNKDSSRIGRFIEFHYNNLQITRLKMNCYFLDQTRIVSPAQNEQNFHIFYQILAGLSPEERGKFHFPHYDSRTLHYLSQAIDPPDSPQQLQNHFEAWKSSLAQLGIPLNDVLKVLIAILLMGNILFYEAKNQELSFQGMEEMKTVALLLGVSPSRLNQGLTMRTYLAQHGSVKSTCSAAGANSARDALAKSLYIRTITAVTRRINTLLKGAGASHSPQKNHRKFSSQQSEKPSQNESVVNIVDLFGFEYDETNSLEQLCINWTTEKLQNLYTQFVFKDTLKASQIEGVDPLFESEVHSCEPCLILIGNNHSGILKDINQETLAPRVSAEDIRVRMRNQFSNHESFIQPPGSSSSFIIKHYQGDVSYNTYSILNANADTLADDIISIFVSKSLFHCGHHWDIRKCPDIDEDCKFGFVTHLFSAEASKDLLPDGSPRGQMCRITPSLGQHGNQVETRQLTSFIQDFQSQIDDVTGALRRSRPYFIRCIKSNNSQTPAQFDRDVVSSQIDQMAIFETVDLIQGGYYHRMYYKDFVRRYQIIAPSALERLRSRAHEMTEDLLSAFIQILQDKDVTEDMWAHGNTQIFLNEEFRQHLEHLRDNVRLRACIKIQSYVRMFITMKHWSLSRNPPPPIPPSSNLSNNRHSHISASPTPPPIPERSRNGAASFSHINLARNYTIVGNYKIAFPQWRLMRCVYSENGRVLLNPGDEIFIVGRGERRGFLIAEYGGKRFQLPHQHTELRIHSSPVPPIHHTTSPPQPHTTYSEL